MMSQDIFVEVGHGPTLIDNNILLSDVSLRMATEGVAMVHNLICGALTCVGEGTGPRYTPYHIPPPHGGDGLYDHTFTGTTVSIIIFLSRNGRRIPSQPCVTAQRGRMWRTAKWAPM